MDASGNTAGETAPNTPSDTQDNSASISDTRAVSEIERHEALAKEAEANEAIERYATGNTQHLTDVETAATDTGRALMAWALGAVGLVVLGAFGWLYQSNNDAALNGTLSLTVTPSDARITLPDSMPRYESGMELEPGDYRVLVRRNGYVSKSLSVTVRNGRHTTSQIELERVLVQRQVGEVFTDSLKSGGQGPEMVVLPTGSFQMGDLSGEGDDDEKPVHTVTIKNSIAVGKYEVTFADYDRFTLATGRSQVKDTRGFGRGRRPAINMTWDDALAYAKWLTTETGQRYRLPSESEWEYAARAGTQTRYSWGDEIGKNRANCDGCESRWDDEQTVPVGGFAPNAFGLHDMHGNVWEWVEDCYEDGYTGAPSDGSARRHCGGNYQPVLRGGSWMNKPVTLRSAHRSRLSPFLRGSSSGFRLVQDLDP
ncbi:MAG: formylglycine-generating enzyme family protein [Pseudomonadota bacterium]